jgi:hypothetical protein
MPRGTRIAPAREKDVKYARLPAMYRSSAAIMML